MSLAKLENRYTVDDYMTWNDDERWEIIGGVAYNMSPAPITVHQRIVRHLTAFLDRILRGKPCEPFVAPTDVILSNEDVVQPDVFVVCDPKKITDKNIQGAPDVVFEILSPYTARKDRREKRLLYETSGVKEYILIDPDGKYAERFSLSENGKYPASEVFASDALIALQSLDGLQLPLTEVFPAEEETEEKTPAKG